MEPRLNSKTDSGRQRATYSVIRAPVRSTNVINYILTCGVHAYVGDAKFFGWRVQTLNNDVLKCLSDGCRTVDSDLQASKHDVVPRSADGVRVDRDTHTRGWQASCKSDLEVVQTIYYSSTDQSVFSNASNNILIEDFLL